ncbi:hypothetical protein A9X03_13655 [Mycobacterium sp. E1715]|nr:hypothetical protein A5704_06900 [Mycobacterium sp. E735]OBG64793.1 hypothetical protein A5703_17100 [Mycobacterium sp. E188]OBG77276.1 hypothetical protein A5701_17760 [Mycobacterium sp. E3305]OBH24448.1 hypothetical protein A9X03_13655 [Mycobacterium sp. E1715]OBH40283.1 hypothetical protein A5691_20865 [Mycobacterium sp. E183]
MDVAGLSAERSARGSRRVGSREHRVRRAHAGLARPESRGSVPSAPSADRAAADAPDAADQRQADYFVRLLSQNRRLIEQRLDDYQKAIATAQAGGDVDAVCNLRRMARIEEQDRDNLDGMLERLRSRFARRAPADPPVQSPRPRSAVR